MVSHYPSVWGYTFDLHLLQKITSSKLFPCRIAVGCFFQPTQGTWDIRRKKKKMGPSQNATKWEFDLAPEALEVTPKNYHKTLLTKKCKCLSTEMDRKSNGNLPNTITLVWKKHAQSALTANIKKNKTKQKYNGYPVQINWLHLRHHRPARLHGCNSLIYVFLNYF